MKGQRKEILVYAHWAGLESPVQMGTLYVIPVRGKELFSFENSKSWIESKLVHVVDPELNLYQGPQYPQNDKTNFGIFLDSAPDRWGRFLMRRREAIEARVEGRSERALYESDYLLGVYDGHRIGGLRFKTDEKGPFLNDNSRLAAPPWASMRELEFASQYIENDNFLDDPEYTKWLNLLLAPGSSLGGARPKASVIDSSGNLWIAKFPSRSDEKDTGAWEMVVWELGKLAGLDVPDAQLVKLSGNQHTFLTKRFDRMAEKRVHFASALTMLGYSDGMDHQDGISYLEMVEFLLRNSADPENDLKQLWRRILFSICVSNTDDHLRNHGFILSKDGWRLSPAFDINPNPYGGGLTLNISENDNSLDPDLAIQVAPYFRIPKEEAAKIFMEFKKTVSTWRKVASKYGIPASEKDSMSKAFI
ncbi:MAG: type II toxin-antitoxin system HipA family toxin [Porphyromonadaceae bacterium]|nr:MAG: type II toxin-antitoxin system HipA family toxin [Porphyromonadaceae bacterium]